ncbi:VTT domain-containing protein OS=Streptomyces microflavus OX=1919 GN=Smic_64570 PE=4 SV=1 [Streptomyces microflavus]
MHLALPVAAEEPKGGIAGWATGLVETFGGPGAGFAIALKNLFRRCRARSSSR